MWDQLINYRQFSTLHVNICSFESLKRVLFLNHLIFALVILLKQLICLRELFITLQTLVQSQSTMANYDFRTVNLTLLYMMKGGSSRHSRFLDHRCHIFIVPLRTWLWEYRLSWLAQQCRRDLVFKVQANTKRPRGFLLHWNSKSDYFENQKGMNTSSTFLPM